MKDEEHCSHCDLYLVDTFKTDISFIDESLC